MLCMLYAGDLRALGKIVNPTYYFDFLVQLTDKKYFMFELKADCQILDQIVNDKRCGQTRRLLF